MRSMRTRPPICPLVLALLVIINGAPADEPKEVRGRVVDLAGMPVAGASVGCFWRANGSTRDRDGKPYDLTKKENARLLWGHLGEMQPNSSPQPMRAESDGRFSSKDTYPYFAVMAMDPSRRHGGIALIPREQGAEPLLIRLVPLVTVAGRSKGRGLVSSQIGPMSTLTCPKTLAGRSTAPGSLVAVPSRRSFEFRLPPGRYTLQAYSEFADKEQFEGELVPNKVVVLEAGRTDVDLGRLRLCPTVLTSRPGKRRRRL